MEIVEEVRNQFKNLLKLSNQIEEEEEDRMSSLPDCLVLEILSRLPSTKDAIRTGILSKRWLYLWTYVPNLVFKHDHKQGSRFIRFVNQTLTTLKLRRPELQINKFKLFADNVYQYESHVNGFICYAINHNVQDLNLAFKYKYYNPVFVLDQFIFNTSSITNLTLSRCALIPNRVITWNNLKTLTISKAKLDEDLIQNILAGSPILETLNLGFCYGYTRLDITSKSLKNLLLRDMSIKGGSFSCSDIIEINAPNILSLTIKECLWLGKLLLLNVYSLVEAYLDCYTLAKDGMVEEAQEEILKGLILKLPHVNTLKVGVFCSKAFSRLEAKGMTSQLKSKIIHVTDHGSKDNDVFGLRETFHDLI